MAHRPSLLPCIPDFAPGSGASARIGVLPGEGIGAEIIDVAVEVLRTVRPDVELRVGGPIGKDAVRLHGVALTEACVAFCAEVFQDGGAVLCGPGGARFVYDLRKHFDLYCKLTPIQPLPALFDTGVVRPEARKDVDVLLVRENVGGLYFGANRREADLAGHELVYRHAEIHRILDVAARLAASRRGRLAAALKPGGLPALTELWSDVLAEVGAAFGVETETVEIDHLAYQTIADARRFDVLVSPNLFGDILADGAALLLGSRGLSYSANFGPASAAVYQTGHGAAYDIAGHDVANPIGQILSVAMLVRETLGDDDAAGAIEQAVTDTVAAGIRTRDIAPPGTPSVGTRSFGSAVVDRLATVIGTLDRTPS